MRAGGYKLKPQSPFVLLLNLLSYVFVVVVASLVCLGHFWFFLLTDFSTPISILFQAKTDKNLNATLSLSQDVAQLKKLLTSVSQMLAKGKEHYQLLGKRANWTGGLVPVNREKLCFSIF